MGETGEFFDKPNKEMDRMSPESDLKKKIIDLKEPLIYLHNHEITREVLDAAKEVNKKKFTYLEVDLRDDGNGKFSIGHPEEFYVFKGMKPPDNLPLETVLKEMKEAGLSIVLDVKHVGALKKAEEIIHDFGPGRCVQHGFVKEFQFKQDPEEKDAEPHWKHEDLPLDKLLDVKRNTGVPLIVSARRLTMDRLNSDEGKEIVEKIIDAGKGKVDAVNFNLPKGEAPPLDIMDRLLEQGILTMFNVDLVPLEKRPKVFLGMSEI